MWVLIAVGGLMVLGVLVVGLGSFVLYRTVKKAGFDPALMQSNPGLAMAKMVAAINPDAEVVSTNDRSGTIVIRDKSTGKVMTMRFDPEKKSMVILGDDGNQVQINASGDGKDATVDVEGADGSLKINAGGGGTLPAWLPAYPGSAPQGTFSSKSKEGSQNTFTFKSSDAPGAVITFYQDKLKSSGFKVNEVAQGAGGGIVEAEDAASQRTVMITASPDGQGAAGSITIVEK
jgi:hypothetical protein